MNNEWRVNVAYHFQGSIIAHRYDDDISIYGFWKLSTVPLHVAGRLQRIVQMAAEISFTNDGYFHDLRILVTIAITVPMAIKIDPSHNRLIHGNTSALTKMNGSSASTCSLAVITGLFVS